MDRAKVEVARFSIRIWSNVLQAFRQQELTAFRHPTYVAVEMLEPRKRHGRRARRDDPCIASTSSLEVFHRINQEVLHDCASRQSELGSLEGQLAFVFRAASKTHLKLIHTRRSAR